MIIRSMQKQDIPEVKVKKDNYPAINLYTSLGFKATSDTDTSYVMEMKK